MSNKIAQMKRRNRRFSKKEVKNIVNMKKGSANFKTMVLPDTVYVEVKSGIAYIGDDTNIITNCKSYRAGNTVEENREFIRILKEIDPDTIKKVILDNEDNFKIQAMTEFISNLEAQFAIIQNPDQEDVPRGRLISLEDGDDDYNQKIINTIASDDYIYCIIRKWYHFDGDGPVYSLVKYDYEFLPIKKKDFDEECIISCLTIHPNGSIILIFHDDADQRFVMILDSELEIKQTFNLTEYFDNTFYPKPEIERKTTEVPSDMADDLIVKTNEVTNIFDTGLDADFNEAYDIFIRKIRCNDDGSIFAMGCIEKGRDASIGLILKFSSIDDLTVSSRLLTDNDKTLCICDAIPHENGYTLFGMATVIEDGDQLCRYFRIITIQISGDINGPILDENTRLIESDGRAFVLGDVVHVDDRFILSATDMPKEGETKSVVIEIRPDETIIHDIDDENFSGLGYVETVDDCFVFSGQCFPNGNSARSANIIITDKDLNIKTAAFLANQKNSFVGGMSVWSGEVFYTIFLEGDQSFVIGADKTLPISSFMYKKEQLDFTLKDLTFNTRKAYHGCIKISDMHGEE